MLVGLYVLPIDYDVCVLRLFRCCKGAPESGAFYRGKSHLRYAIPGVVTPRRAEQGGRGVPLTFSTAIRKASYLSDGATFTKYGGDTS